MAEDIKVDVNLDLKGLKCPMPIVKVGKKIKEMKVGEVLVAETTDPGAHMDFPSWAKTTGNEIVKIEKGDVSRFYIKKLK